jgi:hypothetical protein
LYYFVIDCRFWRQAIGSAWREAPIEAAGYLFGLEDAEEKFVKRELNTARMA